MNCDQVRQRLDGLAEGGEDPAVAHHVENCSSCVRWMEASARLAALWNATRPACPSTETWGAVWSAVVDRLDSSDPASRRPGRLVPGRPSNGVGLRTLPTTAARRPSPGPRRWAGLAAFGFIAIGQAAALLLAVGPLLKNPSGRPLPLSPAPEVARTATISPEIQIAQGQVALIRTDGSAPKVVDLMARETANGMDRWYLVHNEFESFSSSEIEVEEGQVVLIRSEGSRVEVLDLVAQETASVMGRWSLDHNEVERAPAVVPLRSGGVDQWYLLHNEFEWMASSVLAMAE